MVAKSACSVKIDMSNADIAFLVRVVAGKDVLHDTLEVRAYDKNDRGEEPIAVVIMSRKQWSEWRHRSNEMMRALAERNPEDVYT